MLNKFTVSNSTYLPSPMDTLVKITGVIALSLGFQWVGSAAAVAAEAQALVLAPSDSSVVATAEPVSADLLNVLLALPTELQGFEVPQAPWVLAQVSTYEPPDNGGPERSQGSGTR